MILFGKRLFLMVISLLVIVSLVKAQENKSQVTPLPFLYIHGGGGIALSWLASGDIEDILENDFGIGSLGFPFSWHINGGVRNIIQFEFRRGDDAHSIRKSGFVEGGGVGNTGIGTIAEIKMDYDFEDKIVKFNPLFWQPKRNKDGVNMAYFVIFGKGNVKYRDAEGNGFTGDTSILGVEIAIINRFMSAGLSVKRYNIDFAKGTFYGIPFNANLGASDWQLQGSIAVGLGF